MTDLVRKRSAVSDSMQPISIIKARGVAGNRNSRSAKKGINMAFASYTPKGEYAKMLRKRAGAYVKALREDAKLNQVQLAERVGLQYFTMVSQVETGKARVPTESYHKWASALNVPVDEFVKKLLSYYDPYTYAALFTVPVDKRNLEPEPMIDGKPLSSYGETDKSDDK